MSEWKNKAVILPEGADQLYEAHPAPHSLLESPGDAPLLDLRAEVEEAARALGPVGSPAYEGFIKDFVSLWNREPPRALGMLTGVNSIIKASPAHGVGVAGVGGFGLGITFTTHVREQDAALADLLQACSHDDGIDAMAYAQAAAGKDMDKSERLGLSLDQINLVREAAYERGRFYEKGADGFVDDFIEAYKKDPETMQQAFLTFADLATPGVPVDLFVPKKALVAGKAEGKTTRPLTEELHRFTREEQTADAAREKFSGAIVYLFGAITKDPDYKRRFAAAQRYCERWGMTVLNPTRHPVPTSGPLPVDYYMRHCLIDVEACEVMVPVPSPFLEGSAGAAAERAYGECLKKPILDGFVKEG